LDAAPAAYIALAIFIITHSNHRAVRFKAKSMSATRRNRHNIAPVTYIALAMLIPTHSRHCAVRFESDGMITTHRYRSIPPTLMALVILKTHAFDLSRYEDNPPRPPYIGPGAYIACDTIITHVTVRPN
jgi:hypothetical protein